MRTYFFYDLETSGLSPRDARIMQFAGQRTDLDFHPLGSPINLLIKLDHDTLPSPGAIMVTGITPQATQQDGLTEPEFAKYFIAEIATPDTTIIGYNSVRFDDEFIRHLLWRNFHDPYKWQWDEGRSRWDMLDVVRLTRALRPEGIEWPVTPEGRPTNRLELLTQANHISHEHAHDALSDVEALISVTQLIKERQPQLFDYLYHLRTKRAVTDLVNLEHPRPFVYASGRYPSSTLHTTVAYPLAPADNGNVLVFDLRHNLDELLEQEKSASGDPSCPQGSASAQSATSPNPAAPRKSWRHCEPWECGFFPIVKKLQYNRCPAVAPLGVLDREDGWAKISLTQEAIDRNLRSLESHPEFAARMAAQPTRDFGPSIDPESALYDGFLCDQDSVLCNAVRSNGARELADFHPCFSDERLPDLLLHYKAKHFPDALAVDETAQWETYRRARLARQSVKFLEELEGIQKSLLAGHTFGGRTLDDCQYLAEELLLWYQSLQEIE